MILYFSGTGNTKFVAECLADKMNDEILSINELLKGEEHIRLESESPFVIAAPIYAWRFPRAVEQFLKNVRLSGNRHVYCIATRESQSGKAEEYLKKLISSKGQKFMGMKSINMPNQYAMADEISSPESTREYVKSTIPQIEQLALDIQAGARFYDTDMTPMGGIKSGIVNTACYKLMMSSKNFVVSGKCTGCGACAAGCPMQNISMKGNRPEFGKNCTWCFSCIHHCPQAAIDIKGKTEGKPKYVCPDYETIKAD